MNCQIQVLTLILTIFTTPIFAQSTINIDDLAAQVEEKVIAWRRDFHEHPELSNREFETAKKVAAHLRSLGIEVTENVAKTGVKGVLVGGRPGPTVALRADMDALPVTERVDIPFASKVKTTYLGSESGVMHACGHDTHTAMLMGTAEVLSKIKDQIPGTVVFIFQPAEEGAPPGEEGGAELMVKEGVLQNPQVDVAFGLHISSGLEVGKIRYKAGGTMAAADRFVIKVNGKQAHGSRPWSGVDPITIAAQIIMGFQTIISRQTELTNEAAVISVGKITGGVRNNIIPESCELVGTIRTLDPDMQKIIHEKIRKTATLIAEAGGGTADVDIQIGYPVTFNSLELTREMLPSLFESAGENNVIVSKAITGAEDFSFYAQKVPGLFFFLGGMPKGMSPLEASGHHTPDFYIDESGFGLGVRTMCNLTLDYMAGHGE